jgi:phosphoribosylglycinamide formyltransferase 1
VQHRCRQVVPYADAVTSRLDHRPVRIALLASGTGSTAAAIMDAAGRTVAGTVCLVISNNSGSGALAHARERGVPTRHLSGVTHPDPADLDAAMLAALEEADADLVVLAGYMKKLGPRTLARWAGQVVNTHPALLPAYGGVGMYGDRVHAAVLADGASETGASVHVVTAEYDEGPVLARAVVPVEPDDDVASLRTRVQAAEKSLLLTWLAERCSGTGATPA